MSINPFYLLITISNAKMPYTKAINLLLLLLPFFFATQLLQGVLGSRAQLLLPYPHKASHISAQGKLHLQESRAKWMSANSRRLMIGSVAPTCTYNECRGCKFKCTAEQVPVEGNDPMNSAYHYRCVCHR